MATPHTIPAAIESYARVDLVELFHEIIERLADSEAGELPANVTYLAAFIDRDPEPPAPAAPAVAVRFDRAKHCRAIASYGGQATLARHGRAHFAAIGKAGAKVTISRHGVGYWRGLRSVKRWNGTRRPDLLVDLAAGRVLADLAA
jgi:hypothetical protein